MNYLLLTNRLLGHGLLLILDDFFFKFFKKNTPNIFEEYPRQQYLRLENTIKTNMEVLAFPCN